MIPLDIDLDAKDADWGPGGVNADVAKVSLVPRALASGRAGVVVTLRLLDGTEIHGMTTLALLHSAARAMMAREQANGASYD